MQAPNSIHETKPNWLATGSVAGNGQERQPGHSRLSHQPVVQLYTVTPGELVVAYFRGFGDELANKEFYNSKLGAAIHWRRGQGHRRRSRRPASATKPRTTCDRRSGASESSRWVLIKASSVTSRSVSGSSSRYSQDLNVAATAKVSVGRQVLRRRVGPAARRANERVAEFSPAWSTPTPGPWRRRRFAKRFPGYVWLCRYRRGVTAKEISITDDDDGAPLATVDRTNWLSASLGRFRQPRRIILPRDVSHEYSGAPEGARADLRARKERHQEGPASQERWQRAGHVRFHRPRPFCPRSHLRRNRPAVGSSP